MKRICFARDQVGAYVAKRIGVKDVAYFGPYQAIGVEEDGAIIAGAVYCEYNGKNCWVHIAGEPGRHWLINEFLSYGFDYPFNQLKVNRLTGWVEASNEAALRLDLHLGYEIEATLKGAARDGGDVHIVRMFKDDCRYLKGKYAL